MAQARINELNAKIRRIDARVELVRGEGYHYLVFSDEAANRYESESIMVPYMNMMSSERWMAEATAFIAKHTGEA